jgi:hypothetical protein
MQTIDTQTILPLISWAGAIGSTAIAGPIAGKGAAGAPGWDTGAQSAQSLYFGDGNAEFGVTTEGITGTWMAGLSYTAADGAFTMPWGFLYNAAPTNAGMPLQIWEEGVQVGPGTGSMPPLSQPAPGDRLGVSFTGGKVVYSVNYVVVYTSDSPAVYPTPAEAEAVHAQVAIYSPGASVLGRALVGAGWG